MSSQHEQENFSMAPNGHPPISVHSAFYARWAELVIRYRWLALSLVALMTVGAAYLIVTQLRIDHSVETFAPPDSPEIKTLHEFRDTFGRADPFLILVEGDVFSLPFLKTLRSFHEAISQVDVEVTLPPRLQKSAQTAAPVDDFGFEDDDEGWGDDAGGSVMERTVSLFNVRQTRSLDEGIEVRRLLDPFPTTEQLPALRKAVLGDSFLVGQVVGPAGRHAVITAYTVDMYDGDVMKVTDAMLTLQAKYNSPEFKIHITGPPAIASEINTMVIKDLSTLGIYALIAVIFTLFWLFRSWIGVIGPVLVIVISVLWTLGFMAATDLPVSILSGILPAFLFCVGVGDSIHMLSIYRDHRRQGSAHRAAIIEAVSITGPPVFFTSLTTMTGLFSLNFASVTAISQMGIAGGVGVILAWVLSLVILPIMLTFSPESTLGATPPEDEDRIDRFIGWCVSWSAPVNGRAMYRGVLIGATLLGMLFVYGVTQVQVFHDDLDMIPDDVPVKIAVNKLDEHVGGVATAELVITPKTGTLKNLAIIEGIDRVIADVLAYEEPGTGQKIVTHGISIVDIAKETRRALRGGGQAEYRVPKTQAEVQDLLFLFESQSPSDLRKLVTVDWSKTHITFRVRWRESSAFTDLIAHIEASLKRHLSDTVTAAGTGPVYVGERLISVMLTDLSISFATAFLFVTLFMIIMLRDLKLGLIAMLPNLFPIAAVMGFIGLTGIPLDLNTLLIASIALGIAVDDTVHFLHHFQVAYRETERCEPAIRSATYHAGRAMVATSTLLTVGFLIYCLGSNAAIFRFGLLTALTVIAAVLTDLIVLPAFLRSLYPDKRETAET
jgi:uncharacterized protein